MAPNEPAPDPHFLSRFRERKGRVQVGGIQTVGRRSSPMLWSKIKIIAFKYGLFECPVCEHALYT